MTFDPCAEIEVLAGNRRVAQISQENAVTLARRLESRESSTVHLGPADGPRWQVMYIREVSGGMADVVLEPAREDSDYEDSIALEGWTAP